MASCSRCWILARGLDVRGSRPLAYQPGGPGTPWIGVAAGWHSGANSLRRLFDANAPAHGYEYLCRFYAGHLEDMYRWYDMVERK